MLKYGNLRDLHRIQMLLIKLMLKIIHMSILITISGTFLLIPVGSLFSFFPTQLQQRRNIVTYDSRGKTLNYKAPTLSSAPPADQFGALSESCSWALSCTTSPRIETQLLGLHETPLYKRISKNSSAYAALNSFTSAYFYSCTSMDFP